MIGRVVSVKLAKTATVLVERTKTHPLYKKSFKRSKKYLIQDDLGVKLGDLVDVEKAAPISKNKHWRITKVVGRDIEAVIFEELKVKAAEAIEEVMPASPDGGSPRSEAGQGGPEEKEENGST
ncbi:MAG: small subunit ribosomal protein S17 [Microgenomates group bacterium Gr01-1014_80]|nr:MAG: small subunit ribosomal protein S17 [Microgenomates group bacterium Gr01-1014_80]